MTLNRTIPPELHTDTRLPIPEYETFRLDNGIPGYLVPGGTEDISRIDFVFPAGSLYEKQTLTASTVNQMLQEGSSVMTAREWAETLDFHGAYGIPATSKDYASYTLYSLNRHLAALLPQVKNLLQHPLFPEKEMEIYLNKRHQMYLVNRQKTAFLAKDRFEEVLFGKDHPYGRRILTEHFSMLRQEQLKGFHREHYFRKDAFLVASGRIPAHLPEWLNEMFGSLRADPAVQPQHSPPAGRPAGRRFFHVSKEDVVQDSLRMGRLLPGREHPDFPDLEILNTILGGFFGSRLMTSIRQEKGYSYGIHSLLVTLKQTAYCTIVTDLNSYHTAPAVEEIFKQMKRLQQEPLSTGEWTLVKNYLTAEFLRMFDGPLARADSLRTLLEGDQEVSYFRRLADTLRTTGPERIQSMARKYLDPSDWVVVTAGKSAGTK